MLSIETIKDLFLNSKFSTFIHDKRPPVVAFCRGGSATVGLDDEGSDCDMIAFFLGSPTLPVTGVFINKHTGDKVSILSQTVLINELPMTNPPMEFYYLFILAVTPVNQMIINPKYEKAFLEFHSLCQKYDKLFKVCLCQQYMNKYFSFINSNSRIKYHDFKHLYFWIYFYDIDFNLPINKSLITKLKRLKVESIADFSEDEREYFLKVGKYILENYNWSSEKFTETYNQLIEEFEQIQWE